jgi:hypothetical protein
VTSQRGTVTEVHIGEQSLVARMDDGRHHRFDVDDLGVDCVEHGYATTVHRAQGATVDTAHLYADGGGRELGYVAMSRARQEAHVHVVADDLETACDDLTRDWTRERRQRWAIDTGTPGVDRRSSVRPEIDEGLRLARVRAERDALAAVIPADHQHEIKRLDGPIHWARQELYDLTRGGGRHANTPEGRAALHLRIATEQLAGAETRARSKALPRSHRRAAEREAVTLRAHLADARERWDAIGQPVHDRLTAELDATLVQLERLRAVQADREHWLGQHPEALPRLANLDRQLSVDAGRSSAEHLGPSRQSLELERPRIPERSLELELGL